MLSTRRIPRTARTATVLLAGLSLALVLAGCRTEIVAAPASNIQLNTVTATGSGKVSAAPDEATMSFGVTKQAADAKSALDQASTAAAQVAAALKKAGVADKDIQTQNVSVYPQYNSPPSGQRATITGYQASIGVAVTARDLAKLGDLISAANRAGADTVNGPTFTIAEDSPYRDQATAQAVASARRSAEAMAKAAGRTLGPVVSMSSTGQTNVRVPLGAAASLDSAAASVPIQPGQLDVTSDVTVVYQLK
jgi:uncharacterized protein YggE